MPNDLTWQEKYLRTKMGLPPTRPRTPDLDDPATRELTTAQAAAAAHVAPATVRSWAERGLLEPVNDDLDHPRYLELDVLRVEAKTRRRPREQRLAEEAAAEITQAA